MYARQFVNLKRNDDPRLNKPPRDFTSGASADDFKLQTSQQTQLEKIQRVSELR